MLQFENSFYFFHRIYCLDILGSFRFDSYCFWFCILDVSWFYY